MATPSYRVGEKAARPLPPENGSFPLDHKGVCALEVRDYLECVRENKGSEKDSAGGSTAVRCRERLERYLKCRLENNLISRDDYQFLHLDRHLQQPGPAGPALHKS